MTKLWDKKILLNWQGYLVAIVLIALATGIKYVAQPLYIPADDVLLYILAIIPVAFFFGVIPSIFTSIISLIVYDYFFIPPLYTFGPGDLQDITVWAIFVLVALLFSLLSSNLRKKNEEAVKEIAARKEAEAELIKYRDHLEDQVKQRTAELERANLELHEDITERKKVEEALRQSEQRWATTLASIGDAVIATDTTGKIDFMNPVAESLTGWQLHDAAARPVTEVFNIINENTRQKVDNPVVKVIRQGMVVGLANHTILIRKDNTELAIDDSGAPIKTQEGNINGVVLVFRDISERKKIEEGLARQKDILQIIMDNAHTHLVFLDNDFNFVAVNTAYAQTCRKTPEELIGKNHFYFYPNEENEAIFKRVRDNGKAESYHDKPFIFPDQPERGVTYWDWTLNPVKDRAGTVQGLVFSLVETTEHKKTELALQEARDYLNNLLDFASAPIIVWSPDFRISRFNHAFERLTGYSTGEAIGEDLSFLFPTESRQQSQSYINEAITGKRWEAVEIPILRKDGATRIVLWNSATIYAADGKTVAATIAQGQDITERKQLEEALSFERDKLNNILNSMEDGVYIVNRNYDIEYINPALESLFGPVQGQKCYLYFHNQSRVCPWCKNEEIFSGNHVHWELLFSKTNSIYDLTGTPLRNPDGKIFVQEILHDITGRKKAEEELLRVNRELRAISGCNQAMVRSNDEQTLLNDVCRIICDTAGYRMAWIGMVEYDETRTIRPAAWGGLEEGYLENANVTWADTERGRGPTGMAARTGKTHFFQDFVNEPEAVPWLEAAAARGYRSSIAIPLLDYNKNVFGVFTLYTSQPNSFTPAEVQLLEELAGDLAFGIIVLRTRAEHRRAEEEIIKLNESLRQHAVNLEAANKELEAFSYSVSHDLRAPLRTLSGFSQILMEDYGDKLDETGKDCLIRIKKASQLMSKLIDDILRLSRVSRTEIHFDKVNLSSIAQSIAGELQNTQPERRARFIISPDIMAYGDGPLLKIMLQNLLENAWKYTGRSQQAVIEFGAQDSNNERVYFIKDNGVGFDINYASKMFQPFQRLHSEEEFSGTGIGLAIVQRIIHRHGGRIWAEAEVGRGAAFYFTLES